MEFHFRGSEDDKFEGLRRKRISRVWTRMSTKIDRQSTVSVTLLGGLKKVQNLADKYLERSKILRRLEEIPSGYLIEERPDEIITKKITKKNILKLRLIEYLIKDLKDNDDFMVYQLDLLMKVIIEVHLSIQFNKENKLILQRSEACVNSLLEKFQVRGSLSNMAVRNIFQVIQKNDYWKLKDDCIDLIVKICDLSRNQEVCLLFLMESLSSDYEYLTEAAEILQHLFLTCKIKYFGRIENLLVERCCLFMAECDPRHTETKIALEKCLHSLVSAIGDEILPAIASQIVRTSLGKYRSDIADFLFYLCRDKEVCGLIDIIGPLILMLDDRDPDVVIRAYQIFTQILSPTVSCLYHFHSAENFLNEAARVKIEAQPLDCKSETMEIVKRDIKQIILLMLICYIRHAIYPKTLEALLIFNCAVIIEVRDPFILPRLVSFLINLQEAALSIIPVKTMRQSFMQWSVTHLFLLVADVYSISSLKDYVFEIVNQRKTMAPFLLYPIAPSQEESIPASCLLEKQEIYTIIENWNELVEPTRTLHGNSPSSTLSFLSDWRDFDKDL